MKEYHFEKETNVRWYRTPFVETLIFAFMIIVGLKFMDMACQESSRDYAERLNAFKIFTSDYDNPYYTKKTIEDNGCVYFLGFKPSKRFLFERNKMVYHGEMKICNDYRIQPINK